MTAQENVTELLLAWNGGDKEALDKLMPLVYQELHSLAAHFLRAEIPGHTLQTTALVHEAYLRLIDQKRVQWQNRAHFFAVAARMMRRILVNYARDRKAMKRGGNNVRLELDAALALTEEKNIDLVALDHALDQLAKNDERKSRLVELRFFSGLTLEEAAEVLSISLATAKRDWIMAKAWLFRELKSAATLEGV